MQAEMPYKIVLSLGRLHPLKGLDLLISAWPKVKSTSSWKLVIAGPDEQGTKEKLQVESEKLKLKWCECAGMAVCDGDADVVFLGAVQGETKWALMQSANIFVFPSRSENFGMVVGEALSCGVPVVSTAVGPWGAEARSLACADGNRGLIVVETSVAGIAEGLRQMMALSDSERKEMGLRGCEWVKREFSWKSVAQQMVSAYENARKTL